MKLGEEVERMTLCGEKSKFVVTSAYWVDVEEGVALHELTPVPEGMTADDLGRRFPGAIIEGPLVLLLDELRRLRQSAKVSEVS